jgi:DNA-binding transcriptional ArsR family regulator
MEFSEAIEAIGALAQPTRLTVFRLLVQAGPNGLPAGEIAEAAGVPASTMSSHLAILARAGLISARRDSRLIYYAADMDGFSSLLGYLIEDCCEGHPEICAPLEGVLARAAACCAPSEQCAPSQSRKPA